MNDTVKVLLISKNSESRQLYESFINNAGVQLDSVESLQDALFAATRNRYNGILIDLQTLIQAGDKEKESARNLLMAYPVAKVRANPSGNSISVISAGKCTTLSSTIEAFINGECMRFEARSFRSTERKPINLPLILSSTAAFDADKTEKTFTVNISIGGFFIFTAKKWKIGDRVWIRQKNSADDVSPIVGEVRWVINWGEKSVIPGIGVSFTDICEAQEKEIFLAMH